MSSSVYIDSKKKDFLILVKDLTKGLDDTTLATEAQYSITLSRSKITFCWSLRYNGRNSFLFVNATKMFKLKAKDSEIKKYHLC